MLCISTQLVLATQYRQPMPFNEADTRAKLIDPALIAAGWNEDWIRREMTAGAIHFVGTGAQRGEKRVDYVLNVPIGEEFIPLALVEAKAESEHPASGLQQVHGISPALECALRLFI